MNQTARPQLVRDEHHARQLVAAWRSDNVPLKTFCRDRNLSYASLYAWKRRLDRAVPVMLEVKVAAPATPTTYDVVLPTGLVVRVRHDFDDATVARLVAALERPC